MPNTNCNLVPTQATFLITFALFLGGMLLLPTVYAEDDDDDDYKGNLDQEVKQKQKCKICVFGDPQDSVSSTGSGLFIQQALIYVDSDSNLGGIGISMGPL